jgi:hypothetical protein
MDVNVQLLFDIPQQEIASIFRDHLERCSSASLVSGFATVEGVRGICAPLKAHPSKLRSLVVGAGTYRAYQALDELLSAGVSRNNLHVHLGRSRPTKKDAAHAFYRYHPMLHSKVYLMDMGNGRAAAFVGSHNLTGFALHGLNGEASILLEGSAEEPVFTAIRNHIQECALQAVVYDPSMKEAYSWWTTQFFEGLRDKSRDVPRDAETKRTIVVMAAEDSGLIPAKKDIIYFEIPEALGTIRSLQAEVHIYIFQNLPASPSEALAKLGSAKASLWCRTEGLEMRSGGVELRADWHIDDRLRPKIRRTPRPFRPTPSAGMQQVRVEVYQEVFGRFEYLFDDGRTLWSPVFDSKDAISVPEKELTRMESLKLIPPEHLEWYRVSNIQRAEPEDSDRYLAALKESSPESGAYILMSLRRRKAESGGRKKGRYKNDQT